MSEVQGMPVAAKSPNRFLPEDIDYNSWNSLQRWYDDLKYRQLNSADDLQKWIADLSELDSNVSEHMGWLYITMTRDTRDKAATEAYTHFVSEIQPHIAEYDDEMNR